MLHVSYATQVTLLSLPLRLSVIVGTAETRGNRAICWNSPAGPASGTRPAIERRALPLSGTRSPARSVFFLQARDGWRARLAQVSFPLRRWEDGGRGLRVPMLSLTLGDQGQISNFQQRATSCFHSLKSHWLYSVLLASHSAITDHPLCSEAAHLWDAKSFWLSV